MSCNTFKAVHFLLKCNSEKFNFFFLPYVLVFLGILAQSLSLLLLVIWAFLLFLSIPAPLLLSHCSLTYTVGPVFILECTRFSPHLRNCQDLVLIYLVFLFCPQSLIKLSLSFLLSPVLLSFLLIILTNQNRNRKLIKSFISFIPNRRWAVESACFLSLLCHLYS